MPLHRVEMIATSHPSALRDSAILVTSIYTAKSLTYKKKVFYRSDRPGEVQKRG